MADETATTQERPTKMMVGIIVAQGRNGEIGQGGGLPWGREHGRDMRHFMRTTMGHGLVMGARTWESLPGPRRLPGRDTVVLTTTASTRARVVRSGCFFAGTLREALDLLRELGHAETWLAGGARVYEEGVRWAADQLLISHVQASYPEADTHFTPILWGDVWESEHTHEATWTERNGVEVHLRRYVRRSSLDKGREERRG